VSLHVFGVRHHGPGSARSLVAALEELRPDAVLVEGPPDADDVLSLARHDEMKPPVALLVYPPDQPQRAVFYPFAEFSPEWQAIRYALAHNVPVRFIDLPQAIRLARPVPDETADETTDEPEAPQPEEHDPIGLLAEAAGYDDHELWWEHPVERRRDPAGMFDAIREAMQSLRAEATPPPEDEALREAHMRTAIRATLKEGRERVAVVCGAWHAPALAEPGPAQPDAELLRGLAKVKTEATWIPWTHSRLSYRSGYGAGVQSPGWYHHLWTAPDRAAVRWGAQAARLLRAEDLEAPSASVIEVVRLADTLAALRDVRSPGLRELTEAIRTVLCRGESAPLALIRDKLEIGTALGQVPAETPTVPLRRDLEAEQRRLRLKPSAEAQPLDLDLRNDTDRDRSRLFHRLALLELPWAAPRRVSGKAGTFHELWEVRWVPEIEVQLVEAGLWGTTVESAAAARARHDAGVTPDLDALATLLDRAILADVPAAVEHILARVQQQAAVSSDVQRLMAALPPLARITRYGDVRGTPAERIRPVIDALFERIVVGLPGACASLDDDAAGRMVEGLGQVQESIALLDRADQRDEWRTLLTGLLDRDAIHGLVRGWCCRLLVEQQALDDDELGRRAGLALSPANPAPQAAAWLEGLLRGSGVVLLHQDALWRALDAWLIALAADAFTELLPLVRRAFAGFQPAERRTMGENVKRLGTPTAGRPHAAVALDDTVDRARADRVLPVLAHILGVSSPPDPLSATRRGGTRE